jgi:MtN3 and saliva related transmembrane protein
MDSVILLGLAAGALTSLSFLPQLIKTWRSRSAGDISLAMYVIITTGFVLWLWYGILISSIPVIVANVVTLLISSMIMILKIKYR